jgi:hypothetical protein
MSTLLLTLVLSTVAHAATPADVKQVTDFMFGRAPSVHYVKPLWMSNWAAANTSPVYRIVFVEGGRRYTMQYTSAMGDSFPESLDFWERPNGTRDQSVLTTYSDSGLDGTIDFGTGPQDNLYTDMFGKVEGQDNKAYWQKEYDDAIAAALRYYRAK